MAHPLPEHAAAHQSAPSDLPAITAGEAWRLVAPWLGYVFLTAAALLGLFTARGDADAVTYGVGLATFFVAVALIVVRMNRQLNGRDVGFLLPVTPGDVDSLLVTIAVLVVLGLVGAVLAATVGGVLYGIGLALFVVSVLLIFTDMKRYFDLRERG
jgi:hypothetical protein